MQETKPKDKVSDAPRQFKKIQVIINPTAGDENPGPIVEILNKTFGPTKTKWDISIINKHGDGERFAQEAVDAGCDMVAAYGGDGTVMEVACALKKTGIPMAIFPGGTGNAMAGEMNIPKDLQAAVDFVAAGEYDLKTVDMGKANHHKFILRVAIGFEADTLKNTDEDLKKQFGSLAYAFSAIGQLRKLEQIRYKVKVDGETFEVDGAMCMIANSSNLALGKMRVSNKINVSDGLLDLVILDNADLGTLLSVSSSLITGADSTENPMIHHWQGRKIKVDADAPQTVAVDGRNVTELPVKAHVLPGVLKIVVPRQAAAPEDH